MSYPKRILRLRPTRGIASDVPAHAVSQEFYTAGRNVQFRNGVVQRIGGSRAVYGTLPAAVQHMLNARIGGTNFWLFFGVNRVDARETTNSNNITPGGPGLQSVPQPWYYTSTLLNGVPVFTNGLDAPLYWAGSVGTPCATLPGWPAGTICKSIVAFKGFLFALDIDGPSGHFENEVMWSDEADPGTVPAAWTPAAGNLAGSAFLSDTAGPAMCGVPLRGSLIVYKRSSTYAFDLVQDIDQVFTVRTLFTSSGALTRHSVCDINGRHFVVGDGDIYLTDGATRMSVAQGRMKDFLFAQLDQTYYENLFVVFNRAKNEVLVCFPELGSQYCTKAIVYDVAADAFGVRDLASVTCAAAGVVNDTAVSEAWDADAGTWDTDLSFWNAANYSLANESLILGFGTTASMQDTTDAVSVASSIGRYDLDFGDASRVKFVRRVHALGQPGFGTLYVRAGARMSPTDTIAWSNEVTLTEPNQIVNCFAQGRFVSVEARGQDANVWTLAGFDLEAELRGYF